MTVVSLCSAFSSISLVSSSCTSDFFFLDAIPTLESLWQEKEWVSPFDAHEIKKKKFTNYKNSCKCFVPWLLSQLFYNNMYRRKIQIPSIQYCSKSKWVTLCTFLKLTLCFKHKHLHVGDNKRECQPLGYQYSDICFCICIIIVCFNDKTML